jgi:hypothetical protein
MGITTLALQRSARVPATGARKPYTKMLRESMMEMFPRLQANSSRMGEKNTAKEWRMPYMRIMPTIPTETTTHP